MANKPKFKERIVENDPEYGGANTLCRVFESNKQLGELSRYLDEAVPEARHSLSQHLSDANWAGRAFDSTDACFDSVNQEHKETMDRLSCAKEILRNVEFPRPKSIKQRYRLRDEGLRLHIPSYVNRDVDHLYMQQKRIRTIGGSQTVVVCAPVNCSCNYDSDNVQWRAAASVALCQLLHDAGYGVEFWVFNNGHDFNNSGTSYNHEFALLVKGSNEPPDWIRIANAASCWMFRTLYFSLYAHENEKIGGGGYGLGTPQYSFDDLRYVNEDIARGRHVMSVNVGGGNKHEMDEEGAIACVLEEIEKFTNKLMGVCIEDDES